MKLNIMQQLAAFKTMMGIKLFTFTVDFETDTVIAVCKAKPEVRYIMTEDGSDILLTDRKCGIEVLDMVTVQQNKEFMDAIDRVKRPEQPKPTKSEINAFRKELRKKNKERKPNVFNI